MNLENLATAAVLDDEDFQTVASDEDFQTVASGTDEEFQFLDEECNDETFRTVDGGEKDPGSPTFSFDPRQTSAKKAERKALEDAEMSDRRAASKCSEQAVPIGSSHSHETEAGPSGHQNRAVVNIMLGDSLILTLSNQEDKEALALLANAAKMPFETMPLISMNVSFTFLFCLAKTQLFNA